MRHPAGGHEQTGEQAALQRAAWGDIVTEGVENPEWAQYPIARSSVEVGSLGHLTDRRRRPIASRPKVFVVSQPLRRSPLPVRREPNDEPERIEQLLPLPVGA